MIIIATTDMITKKNNKLYPEIVLSKVITRYTFKFIKRKDINLASKTIWIYRIFLISSQFLILLLKFYILM